MCAGNQVVFVCRQSSSSRWTVFTLPSETVDQISLTVDSSQTGTVLPIPYDPGFGFEIYVLPSNSSSSVISELRVTAVRQLNGVTLECAGDNGHYMSTIMIISVGKSECEHIIL